MYHGNTLAAIQRHQAEAGMTAQVSAGQGQPAWEVQAYAHHQQQQQQQQQQPEAYPQLQPAQPKVSEQKIPDMNTSQQHQGGSQGYPNHSGPNMSKVQQQLQQQPHFQVPMQNMSNPNKRRAAEPPGAYYQPPR